MKFFLNLKYMTHKRLLANFEALKAALKAGNLDPKVKQELKHIVSLPLHKVIKTQEQADIFMKVLR